MAYSNTSRADRLYGLAAYCQQKKVTPDDNKYAGIIIQICTAQFGMSREAAMKMAADLKSAYGHDKWASILSGAPISSQVDEQSSSKVEEQPTATPVEKPLDAFKKLNIKNCEPVKRLAPPPYKIPQVQQTPQAIAQIIIKMAENNHAFGVGRVTLSEVRYELGDKAIQLKDITNLLAQHAPTITVETRPGNNILLFFDGTDVVKANREGSLVVPKLPPVFDAEKFPNPPEDTYDTADFKARRPRDRIY
jgi:hypothetical protein